MRIVSLLPSATEIICALGLEDQLVGVTHECDYPASVTTLPKVTRTLIPHDATSDEIDRLVRERLKTQAALYSLDFPVLERLRPDLIVTQTLCDVCAVAEEEVSAAVCSLPGRPTVINLEPTDLQGVFKTFQLVADAAGKPESASRLIVELQSRLQSLTHRLGRVERTRTVLLEWIDPPFSCGHWSPEIVNLAGGLEAIGKLGARSRTLRWSEVLDAQPDALIIACCGFSVDRTLLDLPILRRQTGWSDLPAVKLGQVFIVDGSAYFSRPGPRLVESAEVLAHALHPTVGALHPGASAARRLSQTETAIDGHASCI